MMQLQSIITIISAGSDNNMPDNDSDKRSGKFHLLKAQFGIHKVILEEPRGKKKKTVLKF